MPELEFDQWVGISEGHFYDGGFFEGIGKFPAPCKSQEIEIVAKTFRASARTAIGIPQALEYFFKLGSSEQTKWDYCVLEVRKALAGPDKHEDIEKIKLLYKAFDSEKIMLPEWYKYIQPRNFVRSVPAGFHQIVQTLMQSQIVLIWTALETMVGDLWETAVNLCPGGLAAPKPKAAGTSGSKAEDEPKGKFLKIPWKLLQDEQYEVNTKGRIGTILKESYSFDRLAAYRDTYDRAFSEHAKNVIDSISEKSLDALAIVRNQIVHQSGRVDDDYLRKLKNVELAPMLPKNPQSLSVSDLKMLIPPAMETGVKLIRSVDAWVQTHPD